MVESIPGKHVRLTALEIEIPVYHGLDSTAYLEQTPCLGSVTHD